MRPAYLIETSAWIDYLRDAATPATERVDRLLRDHPDDVRMCEPVAMELLGGVTDELAVRRLERLVNGLQALDLDPTHDFRDAAAIYRTTRRAGLTVRSMVDCLVAAVAIRHDVLLVHKDADFEVIARVSPLRHESLR